MQVRTKKMSNRFRFLLKARMMLFTWEQCILVLHKVNQLMLSLILVVSTLLLQVLFAMTQRQATSNLRNLMLHPILLLRGIRPRKDAGLKLTICINLKATRFSARHPPSSRMVQPSCKASSGRTTLAFSHSRLLEVI